MRESREMCVRTVFVGGLTLSMETKMKERVSRGGDVRVRDLTLLALMLLLLPTIHHLDSEEITR